ncbi:hypothetical protein HMPREF3293_00008 [Christensenella minuta]|uniref:Uncharacterized protein n=1 Tax=Christensenella minuta TaxID=626937 RepID=A0A136Q908_9FIRM|nr:hypothetical protein HMPREF3293_00008 [Christensenella minuta]
MSEISGFYTNVSLVFLFFTKMWNNLTRMENNSHEKGKKNE